ncbi:ATP-grasp domain-containing protein [Psychromonas sp. MME2]|uniref:ATP-grasp domain-containing protein n=1 Tax=unclassified Psychromonas TaxID=2614957 RepID=UPI00339CB3BD
MKQKAILILGGSNDQLFMINTAHSMGLLTVVVDGNPEAPGLKIADYAQAINFSNTQDVIAYCQELIANKVNLAGILTMGSDVPHLLASIAKPFSWVAPSFETAEITTNKFLMKEKFAQHNIAIPQYALITNSEEIDTFWQAWQCQSIIIKPIDAAGSKGVSICSDKNSIKDLYMHAQQNSKSGKVLIEEYIEGNQISTETIIYNGKCYHPGFADRVYNDTRHFYPYIMENGGWQPSAIKDEKYDEICALIEKVVDTLKINNGVLKGDVVYSTKYNKAMIIEVASRLSGGDFSASLVPLAHDINYIKSAIQIALSEPVDLSELTPKTNNVVANRYFFLPPGKLTSIYGIEQAKQIPQLKKLEFNYQIGAEIPIIRNHGQRIGVFIIQADSYQHLQQLVDQVYDTITFAVDDIACNGHPKHYKVLQ